MPDSSAERERDPISGGTGGRKSTLPPEQRWQRVAASGRRWVSFTMDQKNQRTTRDTKFQEGFGFSGFVPVPELALSEVEGRPLWLRSAN